jgi:hypothetical protein
VKDGQTIPSTVEELLTSSDNRGEALAINREFLGAFKAWLISTGKPEKSQGIVLNLARNKDALALQPENVKTKFGGYLTGLIISLDATLVEKYARPIQALQDALEADVDF